VIKVGKLFTMHHTIVAGRFGRVRDQKLADVLRALQRFFRV
jgi:hypothetical protein